MWLLIAIAACIVAFQVQVFDTLLKEHYHKGGGWKRIAWDALMLVSGIVVFTCGVFAT